MSDAERQRSERALARAARLGVPRSLSAPERIELAFELTRAAWSLTGKPWPTYSRQSIPIRVLQRRPR